MKKHFNFCCAVSAVLMLLMACRVFDVDEPETESSTSTVEQPSKIASPSLRSDGAELLYTPDPPHSAQNPAFSPDGRTLLFTIFDQGYNHGPSGLYTLGIADRQVSTLFYDDDHDSVNLPGTSWNPATGRITFASDIQDTDEVWVVDSDGGNPTRVTHHNTPGYFIEPSFSPDGQWIVFERADEMPDDGQQGSVWKIRMDGTQMTQLTDGPGSGVDDRQPNWSPSGDLILFQRRQPGSEDWDIYTMTPEGTDIRRVTNTPSSDTDASWSPDGQWMVYSSDHGDLPAPEIFVISVDGGEPLRVTHHETRGDGAASWSPDGTWIVFESYPMGDEENPASLWRIAAPRFDAAAPQSEWWEPAVGATWQWQLTGEVIDRSFDVDVYDVDLFDTDASVVDALHAQGSKVICYISAGSWEDWRPDAGRFPDSVIGEKYEGWAGENWLDIRQIDLLAPIMRSRLDLCKAKGFDGVEPDNIDAYTNDTGFTLTYQDQLAFNISLANEAHSRGLSIGLKNDSEQVDDLLPHFDWALTEDCFDEEWCEEMLPFIWAGKAVFAAEYTDTGIELEDFCPLAEEINISVIYKDRDLGAWMEDCG
jgi:TolB protein